ncbi:DNA-binding transcriptional regulator LsrR, DeoR family [Propionispira arboris]|uniref:DNA-binding transcriptional regulator LsrR, DeoR family n=1 Tax=Propionispira arboris TaxID=84035 RepID=A0A1H6YK80_9FIRM|nr:sugar-binding domain-containing protein [Propionispira arboris]SEJ37640.1 DNA-binding transcriptional regulator LsrR, DeoR family [Propionispira arboris]
MKKIIDDIRMIFKCCSLYYEDNMSQQEICDFLEISRPSVSRMIKMGKEQGIVKFEIKSPYGLTFGKMERELEKKFNLKEVIIVDSSSIVNGNEGINSKLVEESIDFLGKLLEDGEYVGVTMGMTLQNLTKMECIEEPIKCTFVPIVGGVGESRPDIHSNYIAMKMAKMFGGDCIQFFAPAVFSNADVLTGFMMEKSVKNIFKIFRKINTVIMGIGVPDRIGSTLMHTGYVDENILEEFVKLGAVGDIALQFFDESGKVEKFREFNERVAGMPIDQLKKVPQRIGIAGGAQKAKAVYGAIKGEFLNILITDIDCAKVLLEM